MVAPGLSLPAGLQGAQGTRAVPFLSPAPLGWVAVGGDGSSRLCGLGEITRNCCERFPDPCSRPCSSPFSHFALALREEALKVPFSLLRGISSTGEAAAPPAWL